MIQPFIQFLNRTSKVFNFGAHFSNTLTISGHFTQSHTTLWQVSLLRLTLLDNTTKCFFKLTDRTVWYRVEEYRARAPIGPPCYRPPRRASGHANDKDTPIR